MPATHVRSPVLPVLVSLAALAAFALVWSTAAHGRRRRRENERQELELIYRQAPVGLCVFDTELRYLRINDRLAAFNGLPAEAHLGRTVYEVVPALADQVESVARRVFETGEPVLNFEFCGETPSRPGVQRFWNEHWLPLKTRDGRVWGVNVVVEETTERRRMETQLERYSLHLEGQVAERTADLEHTLEELRATQQQIIRSEKLSALGTLAAGVAHELSNPLMGVMSYVDFVHRSLQEPALRRPLERADEELRRIRDLLKNMLAFARPSGETREPLDLGNVIARTAGLLAPEFRASQVDFETDVPERLPPVVANRGQLQQVLMNLLLNARDAVAESPKKAVRVRAYPIGTMVAVEVADTGVGVDPAIRDLIFDPFFTTKPPGKGTGLGLAIALGIVTELGGRIDMASGPGDGATFTVRLPAAPVSAT